MAVGQWTRGLRVRFQMCINGSQGQHIQGQFARKAKVKGEFQSQFDAISEDQTCVVCDRWEVLKSRRRRRQLQI